MEYINKIIQFLENAVGRDMGRYLLITLLAGLSFVGYGIIAVSVKTVLEKPIRKILFRKEASRFPGRVCALISLVLTAIVLWFMMMHVPKLSPVTYIHW